MLTITAVIRAKKGHEDTMHRALLEVAENVRSTPTTIRGSWPVSSALQSPFSTAMSFW